MLQGSEHSAEVLADEGSLELWAGIVGVVCDGIVCENFVGEVGAGFEGDVLGEDEGVVAVEEEVGYLERCLGVSD